MPAKEINREGRGPRESGNTLEIMTEKGNLETKEARNKIVTR